jgi:AcrR family transcriptional regulator
MAEILDAAARVFAGVGYDQATTNAIAAEAGISPGSLYQFFANKEQIALRLAESYAERLKAVHADALDPALATLPLPKAIDRMVDPFLAFHRGAVGFDALFSGSSVSPERAACASPLEESVQRGLEAIFHARAPKVSPADIRVSAWTCVRLFKAFLPSAISGSKAQQRQATQELKTVLRRYMRPVIG